MSARSTALAAAAVLLASGLTGEPAADASGDVEGQVALDFLRANSESGAGGGDPSSIIAQETGIQVRLRGHELDRRLSLDVDYRGREPVGGDVQTVRLRLLYSAELRYEILPQTFALAGGRFIAPSVAFLPVDGGRAEFSAERVTISGFAGRRAVTTSRRNVDFSDFLPAAGLSASYFDEWLTAEAAYAFSRDEAVLTQGVSPIDAARPYDASSAFVRALVRVLPEVSTGGQVAFAQRASYVIGPTWSQVGLDVHALDLFNGSFFVDWRPLKEIRLTYDLQRQRAQIYREGILAGPADANGNPTLIPTLIDPNYTDNRIRLGWRPFDVGWVRGEFRWRHRPDRQERRYAASADLDHLGVPGLIARGFVAYEDIALDNPGPDLNRALWSASAGWRNYGLDAEIGASFIERRAGPISSRLPDPNDPTRPVDLSPFVLEAQRIAFLRAFYADEIWFVGLDAEQNLADSAERRFFVQIGAMMEASW